MTGNLAPGMFQFPAIQPKTLARRPGTHSPT